MSEQQPLIHPTPPADADVVVVGAGIAGLSAAVTAASAGARVVVLDGHPVGGRARTTVRDGVHHNIGPHALYLAGHLADLLRRHGHDLPGGSPEATRLTLWRAGRPAPLRLDALGIGRSALFTRRSRARLLALLATVPRRRPAELVGRTVDEWLSDLPADVGEFLRAMIRLSSYADAPDVLDAGAALGQLQIGFQGVRYLDGGWSTIVDALVATAVRHGAVVHQGAPVVAVEPDPSGQDAAAATWTVRTPAGDVRAGAVVIAAGGPDTAERLVGRPVPGRHHLTSPVTASALDLTLSRVHCGIHLGLDVPLYLSPHAPVARLAPDGHGLVSVLRYHGPDRRPDDPELQREELRTLARGAGIAAEDVLDERYLHQLVVAYGLPTAAGGGLGGRPTVDALGLPGILMAGDWVGPTGFIADASAASGEEAGRRAAMAARRARIAA